MTSIAFEFVRRFLWKRVLLQHDFASLCTFFACRTDVCALCSGFCCVFCFFQCFLLPERGFKKTCGRRHYTKMKSWRFWRWLRPKKMKKCEGRSPSAIDEERVFSPFERGEELSSIDCGRGSSFTGSPSGIADVDSILCSALNGEETFRHSDVFRKVKCLHVDDIIFDALGGEECFDHSSLFQRVGSSRSVWAKMERKKRRFVREVNDFFLCYF
ncbi:uncharacterized protein LOC111633767 [Centruroides sculpturatus]|uniref:uncharacterized protein LOC111633767 n=1 Tax=Centruroides sculpturatus TaxID=218467 RepID=UPI000C6EFCBF|nr:uncharacterized protein LOC111633767 [Centruroides sculpturatus]